MRSPTTLLAACAAVLSWPSLVGASIPPTCAASDDGPWVALQLGAQGWNDAQRATVLSDLQHTLGRTRDRRLLG